MVKTPDTLERLATITDIVFDKTGTLTYGSLLWLNKDHFSSEIITIIYSLASCSKHLIMKSITRSVYDSELLVMAVEEFQSMGLKAFYKDQTIKLGNRSWGNIESSEGTKMII